MPHPIFLVILELTSRNINETPTSRRFVKENNKHRTNKELKWLNESIFSIFFLVPLQHSICLPPRLVCKVQLSPLTQSVYRKVPEY